MLKAISKVAAAATLAFGLHLSAGAATYLGNIVDVETATASAASGDFVGLFTFDLSKTYNTAGSAQAVNFSLQSISQKFASVHDIKVFAGKYETFSELAGMTPVTAPSVSSTIGGANGAVTTNVATSGNLDAGGYTVLVSGNSIGEGKYTVIVAVVDPDIRISPAPEPESYAMLLAGLGMMGVIARRRQKNR